MEELIKNLFPMNACLLGEGYDNRLEYLKQLISLDVLQFPSGTQLETWTVPDEWIVRDAWLKDPQGNIILDYKTQPLSLIIGSLPFQGKVSYEELIKHLHTTEEMTDNTEYNFKYYDKDWGFSIPRNLIKEKIQYDEHGKPICENGVCMPELHDFDQSVGKVQIEGQDYKPQFKDKLLPGEYEVFIDTEYRPGKMKLGVHTIPGKSKREILLFAHLDHPFQANDNLSSVACLVDLVTKLKADHTIKIIFCPETIGSIAYSLTQDISKVDFVLALECCGNTGPLLMNKALNPESRINRVAHVALMQLGKSFKKGAYRSLLGSDETPFNTLGVPGILFSRFPYPEYHLSSDTPDKINYDMIKETGEAVMKTIEFYEKDFIPVKNFKGPLMRSKYGAQTGDKETNLAWDHFIANMDGKKTLAELCCEFGINFEFALEVINKLIDDQKIIRVNISEIGLSKAAKQKSPGRPRGSNVRGKSKKV